jgi:cytidylate kinase
MKFSYHHLKAYLKNVYFVNGTAYAGKSTLCKILAEKYDMILCGENYKFGDFLALTNAKTHPNMHYFNTMENWEAFVSRKKEDYLAWMDGVSHETAPFEILELISLARDHKVIVDTNIPHAILKEISDYDHVLYMVATPEIAMNEFFNRDDKDKQFLLSVIEKSNDKEALLAHYKETIAYINREEVIDAFKQTGFKVIQRKTLEESIEDKILIAEKHFKLGENDD